MEKKERFSAVAKLYVGNCEIHIEKSCDWSIRTLGILKGETRLLLPTILTELYAGNVIVKPILRSLSGMTEDEMKELYQLVFNKEFVGDNITHRDIGNKDERWVLWSGLERLFIYRDGDFGADSDLRNYKVHQPTIVKWLLLKGFDLFGLIESGQAIDKTTLPTSPPKP